MSDARSEERFADVVIVGAGHAGVQLAAALRQHKFAGSIALIGEEVETPYERPPLSKDYLSGERAFERMRLRPEVFWADRDIDLVLSQRIATVDVGRKRVVAESGVSWLYGVLVWAAGGDARRLSCDGRDLAGVHAIRTRSDVDRLLRELGGVSSIAVVGGGFIGLEAAAALVKVGKSVTVFEAQERLLARVAGATVSAYFQDLHQSHGVEVRLGVGVNSLLGREGRVAAVLSTAGGQIAADMVIAGIGIVPAVAPRAGAGAEIIDGVEVDEFCRTSLPDVFAIGDCARHRNLFGDGRRLRVESVQNANDQAQTVAKYLTGSEAPYAALPWFWSSQYDARLQTVGLSVGYDQEVVRGDPGQGAFSVIYLRNGCVVALDCINNTRDFAQGRALVTGRVRAPIASLADVDVPLSALAK